MTGVTGDRETVAALRLLGKSITLGMTDRAAKTALEPMRGGIERNARALQGRRLGKNLASNWIVRRVANFGSVRRYWLGATGKARRIAHLFEFGIARHSMAKGARRRENYLQDVPPIYPGRARTPFVRPAYDADVKNVPRRFGTALWSEVERELIRSVGRLRRRR